MIVSLVRMISSFWKLKTLVVALVQMDTMPMMVIINVKNAHPIAKLVAPELVFVLAAPMATF